MVGPRQPCPCGSGRRYKACHGSADGPAATYVARPFAGMSSECDLIALRELVPAATAPLKLKDSDRSVLLCTLLPAAAPALVREDGSIWLGLQVQHNFGDPSRDLGAVLEKALATEEGGVVGLTDPPGEGSRLQDLVADQPLEVTVHDGFDYWVADVDDPTGAVHASWRPPTPRRTRRSGSLRGGGVLDQRGDQGAPAVGDAARGGPAAHRARPPARAGKDKVADDSRLVGMFRVHGVLVPVWDLPVGTGAEVLEEPAAQFAADLEKALADDAPSRRRSARPNGLTNRQLTIR